MVRMTNRLKLGNSKLEEITVMADDVADTQSAVMSFGRFSPSLGGHDKFWSVKLAVSETKTTDL